MSSKLLAPAVLALALLVAPGWAQDELKLSRVLLSTGGVGYFEYQAEVEGDAILALDVRLDQVDDVLKSIVVFDDKGGVGTIELPGRQPLGQVFRDLPFARRALDSPVALLNALQGAEIVVGGARPLRGRIIRVLAEQTSLGEQGVITRHRVSLLTPSGIRQFILEDVDAVGFRDPGLREAVEEALRQVAAHRARDRRTLTIQSRGEGRRRVRVGYVVGAPLWKASYRLTLDADPTGKEGLLQGWAVVENLSGQHWEGVELTLASGNPVTFRQALYQAYFVDRPEVPVEVLGRVLPKLDSGLVAAGEAERAAPMKQRFGDQQKAALESRKRARPTMAMSVAKPPPMATDAAAPAAVSEDLAIPGAAGGAMAVRAGEATTQVVFTIGLPIDVESGNSLAIPIVDRSVTAERLALHRPGSASGVNPLSSVRLVNEGESGLPPGVLTLYERRHGGPVNYVGDARMGPLPAGEHRLLSFAVDNKTKVDVKTGAKSWITKGKINRGLFHFTRVERRTTTYRVKAPAREARKVMIEHPIRRGWRLVTPEASKLDRTSGHYRLTRVFEAGESAKVEVVAERPVAERIRLLDITEGRVGAFIGARELTEPIREAFRRMLALKKAVDAAAHEVGRIKAHLASIDKNQKRIRDNLARVPRGSGLHNRYLRKLGVQEDEIERLQLLGEDARAGHEAAREKLSKYVAALDL